MKSLVMKSLVMKSLVMRLFKNKPTLTAQISQAGSLDAGNILVKLMAVRVERRLSL